MRVATTIYLDVCCCNRPFDSQIETRVRLETEAKLCLQEMAKEGRVGLAWSYVLDYENGLSPLPGRRDAIAVWRDIAPLCVEPGAAVADQASLLVTTYGLKGFDALHVACAVTAGAELFMTTDDFILKKLKSFSLLKTVTPIEALSILEQWYES